MKLTYAHNCDKIRLNKKVIMIDNQKIDSGIQIAKELVKYNCEVSITGDLEPAV